MKIETIVVGPLQVNCYLIYDEETKETIIVDPGDDADLIIERIESLELMPLEMWLTHGHFDHLGAASKLFEKYSIPLYLSDLDYNLYKNALEHANMFGLSVDFPPSKPCFFNMKIAKRDLGHSTIEIIPTPGHSQGSVSFYIKASNVLLTGDLIFEAAVGRTDLPGSSYKQLENSILQQVYTKGDACRILPGHGPDTTVSREKRHNPFVKAKK